MSRFFVEVRECKKRTNFHTLAQLKLPSVSLTTVGFFIFMELGKIIAETISADIFKSIKHLYYSEDQEDKDLARNWLTQLIGESDAEANLFVLEILKEMDNDAYVIIDAETYLKMKFKTFTISFGKNYMYEVQFDIKFKGETVSHANRDYSRYRVGDGDPKYDALDSVCKWLRKHDYTLHNDIFK